MKYSFAFIVMSGGVGTLDELFEAVTLIQTKMIKHFPIVIFGKEYHKELYEHIQLMAKNESIDEEDMKLLFITDFVDEMVTHLKIHTVKKFGLIKGSHKTNWFFWRVKAIKHNVKKDQTHLTSPLGHPR